MGRYLILSSAPAGVGNSRSCHPDFPRSHGSFDGKEEAESFANLLRTNYSIWHMHIKVVVFDSITEQIVEK
jgi:hypothetical protein